MGFVCEYFKSCGKIYKLINIVFVSNKNLTSRIPLIIYQDELGIHYAEKQSDFDLLFNPTTDKKLINAFKKSLKKNLDKIDQNECEALLKYNVECSKHCNFCKNKLF